MWRRGRPRCAGANRNVGKGTIVPASGSRPGISLKASIKLRSILIGLAIGSGIVGCGPGASQPQNSEAQALPAVAAPTPVAGQPAFPGAEGFGAGAVGGRGGRIIAVTTLADDGPGSFRACVTTDVPRVCVFRVGGVVRFTSAPPVIKEPFLTIAGETAPGDGITLAHGGGPEGFTPLLIKNTNDIVVRDIRSRPDVAGEVRGANDAITIENSRNVILDHVSGSWGLDENINGHRQNDLVTISWSIFAEGIPKHDKCALLGSDPTGPQRFSFIRNICAHHGDRNPDLNFAPRSCVEIYNNIFYNAGGQFAEIWESYGGTWANIAGNTFRAGPDTSPSAIGIDRQEIESKGAARVWLSDNAFDGSFVQMAPRLSPIVDAQPVCPPSVRIDSAAHAYPTVLAGAGAFPRDSFDERIVGEVRSRTGAIVRSPGEMPVLAAGTPYPDRDSDGMSDGWEAAHGTDPATADSWGDRDGNGWANLEDFLAHAHRSRVEGKPVT